MNYLLDTNIIIYYLHGDKKVKKLLNDLKTRNFAISVVSRLEVLLGFRKHKSPLNEIRSYLDVLNNLAVGIEIVEEAFLLFQRSINLSFEDLLIAASAKNNNLTLITADKRFSKIDGLKVLEYKIK